MTEQQVSCHSGPHLDSLQVGQTVGLLVDSESVLHLYVDGTDRCMVARSVSVSDHCHAIIDVYGQCEAVSTVDDQDVEVTAQPTPVSGQEKADQENGLFSS